MTPKALLEALLNGTDLPVEQAEELLRVFLDVEVPDAMKGALLAALRAKGETATELLGMARAMRAEARAFPAAAELRCVDTCGTGGDGSHSFNVSTATSLLVAAAGVPTVKHGNRSISSRSGSADLLEVLGVPLFGEQSELESRLRTDNFAFLFAPAFHPSMKAVGPVRRALGVRTAFNLLGPLSNPAAPPFQLLGAFSLHAARLIAEALSGLPIERAFVVHGAPHWDEATPVGPFHRLEVRPGTVKEELIDPLDYGVPRCAVEDLAGGDAAENAATLRALASGVQKGAVRDAVVLNAALVFELLGEAPMAAADRARATLDSGQFERWLSGFLAR